MKINNLKNQKACLQTLGNTLQLRVLTEMWPFTTMLLYLNMEWDRLALRLACLGPMAKSLSGTIESYNANIKCGFQLYTDRSVTQSMLIHLWCDWVIYRIKVALLLNKHFGEAKSLKSPKKEYLCYRLPGKVVFRPCLPNLIKNMPIV